MTSTNHRELRLNTDVNFERLDADLGRPLADERGTATARCAAAPVDPFCERYAAFERPRFLTRKIKSILTKLPQIFGQAWASATPVQRNDRLNMPEPLTQNRTPSSLGPTSVTASRGDFRLGGMRHPDLHLARSGDQSVARAVVPPRQAGQVLSIVEPRSRRIMGVPDPCGPERLTLDASQLNHNPLFLRTADDVACGRSLQPVIEPKRLSRKMENKKVAGVCMVRDSVDIVPFLCGHYLRIGVDHIHFVDDGSTDGTYDLLRALARRTGKIQVSRLVNTEVVQRATVENMANELVDRGFRFILPFDADEFWNISPRQLAELGQSQDDQAITGRWVNFVQRRSATYPAPFGIYGAVHRFVPTMTASFEEVVGKTKPWLAVSLDKVAFASRSPVTLLLGQHALIDGPPAKPEPYEIFHLPLRSRTEIEKRGLNYEPRRTASRHDPDESWQSAFHREIVISDDVDSAWAANSADRFGRADVFGSPAQLVRDTRLRTLLASAAAYLLVRYGWLTL